MSRKKMKWDNFEPNNELFRPNNKVIWRTKLETWLLEKSIIKFVVWMQEDLWNPEKYFSLCIFRYSGIACISLSVCLPVYIYTAEFRGSTMMYGLHRTTSRCPRSRHENPSQKFKRRQSAEKKPAADEKSVAVRERESEQTCPCICRCGCICNADLRGIGGSPPSRSRARSATSRSRVRRNSGNFTTILSGGIDFER